eukprot:9332644-Pyramimonas_sp.AAC.1
MADAMALPPPGGVTSPRPEKEDPPPAEGPPADGIAGMPTVAAAVIELMCSGVELADEGVELQVLKGMLTTVSCASFQLRLLPGADLPYPLALGLRTESPLSSAPDSSAGPTRCRGVT